jgi:hypothetical protein
MNATPVLIFNQTMQSYDVLVDDRMVFSSQDASEAVSALKRLTVDGVDSDEDDYWASEPMSQASAEFMARQPSSRQGVSS